MSSKKAVLAVVFLLILASMACTNPITSYFSTRTAVMETATATMWTPTPTNTRTFTPTFTPTKTPTRTLTPTSDNRFYEKGAAIQFSYVPPEGWTKSKGSTGTTSWSGPGGVQLTFIVQASSWDAAFAGAQMEDAMKATFPGYKLVEEGVFSPDSGLDAYRFAFSAPYQGVTLYFEVYVFSGSGYLVEGLYLRSNTSNQDQDAVIMDTMMTMRFEE